MNTAPQLAGERCFGACFWSADPPQLSIDSNGNLTQKIEGNDTWTYEWDAENRLKRVLKNAAEVARFAYDPMGRRVEKVAGGTTTTWTYDGDDVLKEVAGATTRTYVHGLEVDEHLAIEGSGGTTTYLHADGIGTVFAETSASGAVTATWSYDAFGSVTPSTTAGYRFTGREWDPEIGLYYRQKRVSSERIRCATRAA